MISSAANTNQQMAKILERQRLLPIDVIDKLMTRSRTLQEWLAQVAVDDRFLTYGEVAKALAQDLKIPLVDLAAMSPHIPALECLPPDTCRSHGVVPLHLTGSTLIIAMANPLDDDAKTTLRSLASCDLSVRIAPLDMIQNAIADWYALLTTADTKPAQAPLAPPPDIVLPQIATELPSADFLNDLLDATRDAGYSLDELIVTMVRNRASDLHLAVGSPPMMRVDGELRPMQFPALRPNDIQDMVYAVLTDVQITFFERHWELDFAYSMPGLSRFRINVHRQRGSIGAVLRTIPSDMPTLDKLQMPAIVRELTTRPRGLVLVTGPTGSGKSTTLAAMVDEINRNRRAHIVTIEDPIEFMHHNKLCVVTQREVGADTESFSVALRHVLRQDPDVILIGEMRDLETISAAVTAAETGHLVFATLHTTSASQTIDRIIDVFPPHQQEQIRSQLSNTLEGILTQTLVPNIDGRGRSCAQEILIATPAIRNLIREGKVHQMTSVIQASAKYGMQTLDMSLKQLVLTKKISLEEAILKASNPDDFKALVAMQ